jgi:hypothetical protein
MRTVVRALRDCVFRKHESGSMWIALEFKGAPGIDALEDPDRLLDLPQCEIVKDQRKIKVGRVVVELAGRLREVYVKRYNPFSWRHRVGSLFVTSAAIRSFRGAKILTDAGFSTGEPVAAVECRRWGLLGKSFYLSQGISQGRTVDAYWRERLAPLEGLSGFRERRDFLRRLAELVRSLHDAGIYHNDLKDANIVISGDCALGGELFRLLDLEGVRRCRRLSERRKIKNLVQLHRTMGRVLSRSERLYGLRCYLGDRFLERRTRKRWMRKILTASAREEIRSLRRRRRDTALKPHGR